MQSPAQLLGGTGISEYKCAHMSDRDPWASVSTLEVLFLIIKLKKEHILSRESFGG